MRRPRGCGPFAENDDNFLDFCITCRASGIAASLRLNVRDPFTAYDLDRAVAVRLIKFDREEKRMERRLLGAHFGRAFGGGDDPEQDLTGVHPLIAADPFSDENTVVC